MKVSERTLNIWAVIEMHKDTAFKNASFMQEGEPRRITRIKDCEYWKLRVWKEHFFKFSESQRGELDFVPDSEQQLDDALESEMDKSIQLLSLLQRSAKQVAILQKQRDEIEKKKKLDAEEDLFDISTTPFQNV